MKKSLKITIALTALVVILVLTIGPYLIFGRNNENKIEFALAQKTTILQEVSVTGRVKAAENVDLSFEQAGKIAAVYVKVGNKVKKWQVLVEQETSELETQLEQYQAGLEKEQAELEKLKRGSTLEEISVARTKVENAKITLEDKQINLSNVNNKAQIDLANVYDDAPDVLQETYTKADDAVNKQTDSLFNNDSTNNPELTFSTTNLSLETETEEKRVLARDALAVFKEETDNLTNDYDKLDKALNKAESQLMTIRDFLNALNDTLNVTLALSQTTVNTYKGYVNTGKTNINDSITSVNNQKQAIAAQKAANQNNISTAQSALNDAQSALQLAQKQLELELAGASSEDIKAQEAVIKAAQANVANTEAKIAKKIIHSPIDGLVSKQEAKVGEITAAQNVVVSLISEGNFQIESNIPEVDIAKVKVGDNARITLDAYSDDIVFSAQIISIDPAETIIEGVATYKVTLQFTEEDKRIKSGMTANLDILTAKKDNVITVPIRAIITKNGQKFVRVLKEDKNIEEIEVITGLKGSDGSIEIVQGLNEGNKVVVFFEEK